jgi:putative membrane protein
MVQHLLLGMYAPLGLVLGAPVTLLLGTLPVARRGAVVSVVGVLRHPVLHALTHPVAAGTISVVGLYVLYLTPLLALSERSTPVHHLVHVHVLAAGCLLTWSLVGPDPAPRRPGMRTRVVVLVVTAGAHAYLAKLLFARAGDLPPGTDHPVDEAEQAALLMYYGGDVAEILLAVALFAWWLRNRRRRVRLTPGGERQVATAGSQAGGSVTDATTTGSAHPRA